MIKIAQETYKLANEMGHLNIYLTWCMLKSYNVQGTIKRDRASICKVAIYLNKSESSLRLHLTKLVGIGLIKRSKYSYSLVSYDRCWEFLGLDLTKHSEKDRKGSFLIFKYNGVTDLKENIELSEIQIHTKRQAYQARKSILKDSDQFTDTEKKAVKDCRFTNLPILLDNLYIKKLSVLRNVERSLESTDMLKYCEAKGRRYSYTKITPYLTCERTSIILGYEPNPRMGLLIRKRVERAGLASWETRNVEVLDTINWKNAVIGHKACKKYPDRLRDNGLAIEHRLISKFVIL